jgi:hypothetical protein
LNKNQPASNRTKAIVSCVDWAKKAWDYKICVFVFLVWCLVIADLQIGENGQWYTFCVVVRLNVDFLRASWISILKTFRN